MERKKVLRLFNLQENLQAMRQSDISARLENSIVVFRESVLTINYQNSSNYTNVPYDSIETMAIFWNGVEIDTADGGHVSLDITQEQYLALLENGCPPDA